MKDAMIDPVIRLERAEEALVMIRARRCTLRVTQQEAKLLLTTPEQGDLLEARLDPRPCHPRALLAVLEGRACGAGPATLQIDPRPMDTGGARCGRLHAQASSETAGSRRRRALEGNFAFAATRR